MERIKKCVIYALSRIKVNLLDVNHNRNLKHHETHVVRNNYTSDYTQTNRLNKFVCSWVYFRKTKENERTHPRRCWPLDSDNQNNWQRPQLPTSPGVRHHLLQITNFLSSSLNSPSHSSSLHSLIFSNIFFITSLIASWISSSASLRFLLLTSLT